MNHFEECLKSSNIVHLQPIIASNAWLEKYLKRVSTSSVKECGEHNNFKFIQVEKRLHEICEALIDVSFECIINIDESALQHRTTSPQSYCTANSNGRGVKKSKDKITVTLGVSASSETFITQV